MRISEVYTDAGIDKFVIALRNHIGRASSQKAPAALTWDAIAQMSRANGFEFAADYETFKAMHDAHPMIQNMVHNFNDRGVVLNVPGAPNDKHATQDGKTSQDEVDKIAASNAEANLGDSYINDSEQLDELTMTDPDHTFLLKSGWKKYKGGYYLASKFGTRMFGKHEALEKEESFKRNGFFVGANEDTEDYVSEISADLTQRYKEKSAKVIKDVEPFTKKGEYRDLAKKLVARRQAGLNKATTKGNDMRINDIATEVIGDDPNRDAIRMRQAKHHRNGNKITWDQAKAEIEAELNPPQPKKQRAPRAPRVNSSQPMSARADANFKKTMQGAASDFQADFGDSGQDLGDVAWDLAGSLMHNPEIETYVRRKVAYNSGQKPNDVDSNIIQDYIADEIYDAGTTESLVDESTDIADFGNVNLTQYSGKEGKMIQVTAGHENYIQLNKQDAAKVARALGQWANSK